LRTHVIPVDAPGVRELVNTLLSIWPEFEWERLGSIQDRTTCGRPPLFRTRLSWRVAEILKSFKPPYEISFGPVKPGAAPVLLL
jgi:hypothetical protein